MQFCGPAAVHHQHATQYAAKQAGGQCRRADFRDRPRKILTIIIWRLEANLRYFRFVGTQRDQGIGKLNAAQVETLRHVLAHRNSKEIARIMGVSPHTVDERIRRAMRLLGVSSRVEAARLVAVEPVGATYQPLIYQPPQLGDSLPVGETGLASAEFSLAGLFRIGLPFPTRSRPYNNHGRRERLLWPVLIAFGTIMAFAALYSVLLGLGEMLS